MLAHAIYPLLLPALTLGTPPKAPETAAVSDPPVRIWLDNDARYIPGDEGRVEVRADRDGYLLVLQVDPAGNVRVLFPLDPSDDNFVRGGRKYELVGRGGRKTFYVESSTGTGTIYAAHSLSPFAFQDYVRNGHWDYQVLYLSSIGDIEGALTDLVGRMTSDHFDYDVLRYEVADQASYAVAAYPAYSIYDPYYTCFTCGRVYYGSGFSFGISIGFGDPWYDPWFYPTYPVYYGYRHYYPYYPYYAYRRHYWYGHRPYYYPYYPRHRYAGRPYRPDYRFKPWWENSPRRGFDDGYRRRDVGVDVRLADYRRRTQPDIGSRSRTPVQTARPNRPVDRQGGAYGGRRTTVGAPVTRPTDRGTPARRRAEPARPTPTPRAEPRRGDGNAGGRRVAPRKEPTAAAAPRRTERPKASPPTRRQAKPNTADRNQRPGISPTPRRQAQPRSAPRSDPRASGRRPTRTSSDRTPWRTTRPQYSPAPRGRTPILRAPSGANRSASGRREARRSQPSRVTRPSAPRPSVSRARPSRPSARSRGGRRKP